MRGVLPAGTTLRGYELKSILGQGAFGITYRARDTTLHRDVAIKEYLPTSLALREGRTTVLPRSTDHAEQFAWGRERFLDEARTLARLDRTPAIVRVHDYLEDNGTAYMVMALIEGETLNKRLMREQRLTPEAIERLVFPLLDGLEEVHAAGFLHRDIKPANIMVDDQRPADLDRFRRLARGDGGALDDADGDLHAGLRRGRAVHLVQSRPVERHLRSCRHALPRHHRADPAERDRTHPEGRLPAAGRAAAARLSGGAARRHRRGPGGARGGSAAEHRRMAPHAAVRGVVGFPGGDPRRAQAGPPGPRREPQPAGPRHHPGPGAVERGGRGDPACWPGRATSPDQANAPGTASTAALSLSAEQLEQALAERRKADALAAEKRRLEDEARQKAEAEAEAKRQAEAELEQARQARQKAEDELATAQGRHRGAAAERRRAAGAGGRRPQQRAAEEDAQRKAEAEAAALRQAEEEAGKRAAADAEAKRQADEALARAEAERQRADADARAKAEAETAARQQAADEAQRKAAADAASKRQADEAQAKAQAEREKADAEAKAKAEAETAERGLRLESADRQRLQVALTSLGFDTRGSDGVLRAALARDDRGAGRRRPARRRRGS